MIKALLFEEAYAVRLANHLARNHPRRAVTINCLDENGYWIRLHEISGTWIEAKGIVKADLIEDLNYIRDSESRGESPFKPLFDGTAQSTEEE